MLSHKSWNLFGIVAKIFIVLFVVLTLTYNIIKNVETNKRMDKLKINGENINVETMESY